MQASDACCCFVQGEARGCHRSRHHCILGYRVCWLPNPAQGLQGTLPQRHWHSSSTSTSRSKPPPYPPPPPWPPHPTCTGATPAWSVSWSRRKPRQSLEDITSAALPTPNLLYPPTHHTGLGHIKLGTTMCFSDVELHSVFFPFRSRYGRTERWGVPGQ